MADKKGSSTEKNLYCSFCGKSQHEVKKLIAGPSVFICDECIDLCNDIIRDELPSTELAEVFAGLLAKMEEEKAKGAASENVTPFSEITDDDIDALFG